MQVTAKERNSARHHGCRGQFRSIDRPEERFGTPCRTSHAEPGGVSLPASCSTPQQMTGKERNSARHPPGLWVNAEAEKVRKNDTKPPAEKRVMFPRPCSIPQQVTGEGTELCQASWLRVQLRSVRGQEERFITPGRTKGHPTTVRRDIPGHRTCRDRFGDTLRAGGVSPWCCRVISKRDYSPTLPYPETGRTPVLQEAGVQGVSTGASTGR